MQTKRLFSDAFLDYLIDEVLFPTEEAKADERREASADQPANQAIPLQS